MANKIQTGDSAPDFTLKNAAGKNVSLGQYLNKQAVVLYFYPKDNTPGCTAEACSFRDQYEDFKELGAEVIGISSDSEDSHEKFAQNHRLPFVLLSDPGGKVRKSYGVPSTFGLLPGRVTYVIDKAGDVRHVFNSQLQATKHIEESLQILRSMSS